MKKRVFLALVALFSINALACSTPKVDVGVTGQTVLSVETEKSDQVKKAKDSEQVSSSEQTVKEDKTAQSGETSVSNQMSQKEENTSSKDNENSSDTNNTEKSSDVNNKLTNEQALLAIKKYNYKNNPELENMEKSGEYTIEWDVSTNESGQIVVYFRSYTAAQIRYYIDPVTGDAYVTELVPGIIDEETRSGETLNVRDYL